MAIELPEFNRRLQRKVRSKGESLKDLYARTCTVDGVQADTSTGICRVCGRQVFQVERDPVPAHVLRPVDPAKAELQKQFYARLERQRKEREAAAEAELKKNVTLLPGESLPGDPPTRNWARVVTELGFVKPRW